MILNIAAAGKMKAETSSSPTTEPDGSFSWTGMLRAEFDEKWKKKPIRSGQSATLFMHVPISAKLAHFLLKHSKQIHILKGKNREIRNCDVIRAIEKNRRSFSLA
jgi:hypothetical protein